MISGKTDGILSSIYSLIVFVPSVSILVRRAHDFGKSTSFVFGILGLIIAFMLIGIGTLVFQSGLEFGAMSVIIGTVISVGFLLYALFKKGDVGENEYGDDPKENE